MQKEFQWPEVVRFRAALLAKRIRRAREFRDRVLDVEDVLGNVYPMQKLHRVTVTKMPEDLETWGQEFLLRHAKPVDRTPEKPHKARPWGYKGPQFLPDDYGK